MSACRSCGAKVIFVTTNKGKVAPFQRDDAGAWVIDDGVAQHVGTAGPQLELGKPAPDRYTPHFATCPQAEKWRTRGSK